MDKGITFEKSHFVSAEFKIARGGVATYMHAIARLSRPAARAMGAEWTIYDQDSTPKAGCKKWELDYEVRNADAVFDLQTVGKTPFHLALRCPLIDRFIIVKIGEGKRKAKSTYLAAKFRMLVDGREQELLEFLKKVGGGEGKLVLASREEQLALQDQAKAEPVKSNSELFGQPRPQIVPEMVPAKQDPAVKVTGPDGQVAFEGTATEFHEAVNALSRGETSTLPASAVVSMEAPVTDWPQPNENGVFDREDSRVIHLVPHAKDGTGKAGFTTKGTDAEILVLQIGPDQWVFTDSLHVGGQGASGPLMAVEVQPTQIEAEAAALLEARDIAHGYFDRPSNPTDERKWRRILSWIDGELDRPGRDEAACLVEERNRKAEGWQTLAEAQQEPEPEPALGDWPQPNEDGVYDEHDARVVHVFPRAKDGSRRAIFMTEGTDVEVRVLQIGPDEWIYGLTLKCCDALVNAPLERGAGKKAYPNQVEAAVAAYNRMDLFARRCAEKAPGKEKKKWDRVLDWLDPLITEGEIWIGEHAAPPEQRVGPDPGDAVDEEEPAAEQLPNDPEFAEAAEEVLEPVRVMYDEEIKGKPEWYARVRVVAMEDGYNYAWWVRLGKQKTPLFSDQGEDFIDLPCEAAVRLALGAVVWTVRLQLKTAPDDQMQKLKTPVARVVAWANERHSEQPQQEVAQ